MNIKRAEYVVFDVETTGLNAEEGDRIVEIAAVRFKNNEIVDRFESLINPGFSIPQEAQAINGITDDMLKTAPTSDQVLPQMIDFIAGGCLVGPNVRFDLGFLCYELSLLERRVREATPALDTLKIAKELLPYLKSYRLSNVALNLGIPVKETHRAMPDVELTARMLGRLLDMAEEQQMVDFSEFYKRFGVEKPNYKMSQGTQGMLF